jgi:hypothetical protein
VSPCVYDEATGLGSHSQAYRRGELGCRAYALTSI